MQETKIKLIRSFRAEMAGKIADSMEAIEVWLEGRRARVAGLLYSMAGRKVADGTAVVRT
jgi:hypothetical protein